MSSSARHGRVRPAGEQDAAPATSSRSDAGRADATTGTGVTDAGYNVNWARDK